MQDKKPAIRSMGVLGSIGSIGALIGVISTIRGVIASIPPEQITEVYDLSIAAYVAVAALVGAIVSLFGRLKADKRVSGLLKVK